MGESHNELRSRTDIDTEISRVRIREHTDTVTMVDMLTDCKLVRPSEGGP